VARDVLESVLVDWQLDPLLALGLVAAAGAYGLGVVRARRWPARRTAAFLAGLALVAFALESGLHPRAEELLSAHMVQHLILVLAAPPLLLLGEPLVLALRTLPPGARRALARAVQGRAARLLAHPAIALALFAVVLVGSHAPSVYEATLRSEWLHGAEHAAYLWVSLALWVGVLGLTPMPRPPSPLIRVLVLLASMPPMALIGVGLMSSDRVVYPSYLDGARQWHVSALADQHLAAGIMWIGGSFALIGLTVAVAASALRREEARAVAREAYADRRATPGGISP
jgi:putative copper resistance protein D